jgi:hypothetical protein
MGVKKKRRKRKKERRRKKEKEKKFIWDKLGVIQYAHCCIFFFQSIYKEQLQYQQLKQ